MNNTRVEECEKRAREAFVAGQFEKAVFYCYRGLELNDEVVELYKMRAESYFKLGYYEHALLSADSALELRPDDADVRELYASVCEKLNEQSGEGRELVAKSTQKILGKQLKQAEKQGNLELVESLRALLETKV